MAQPARRAPGPASTRLRGSRARSARSARRTVAGLGTAAVLSAALGACGSASRAELPAPAGPDPSPPVTAAPAGRVAEPAGASDASDASSRSVDPTRTTLRDGALEARLDPRARELAIIDTASGQARSRLTVGVGPTHVACAPQGPCFVTDTQGDALLVVRVGEGGRGTRISRRVYVAGAPFAIATDPERRRLWVTLTARNELVELGLHGRPHVLARLPTIRQPDAVAVAEATGELTVTAPSGQQQRIPDPSTPDR